ncbi:MAG: thiolase family protein, partial [Candidatus Omnitrophica bacterium]|nr:thiolase family protein [Candidatus Omnitrophota bacterium]
SAAQAFMKIQSDEGSLYFAGGTESMSNIPLYYSKKLQNAFGEVNKARTLPAKVKAFLKLSPKELLNPTVGLMQGLSDPVCGLNMGQTAEVLAKEFGITRQEQDEFALISHQRAINAREILREEIIPVAPGPDYKKTVIDDNGPREGQSMEALQKLKPVFDRYAGTVTAGNASQITDGACALLIGTEEKAKIFSKPPLGYIRAFAFSGVEPNRMGIGPAHAIPKVLKKAGMKLSDVQAIEINEAFAVQVLACLRALASNDFAKKFGYEGYTGDVRRDILNVNGGAIALGHPVGTTGSRLILTMLKHMQRKNLNVGLISLCIGGGQGAAMILER